MPPNPERRAKMAAKREAMANDPKLAEAQAAAVDAVMGRGQPDANIRTPDAPPIAAAPATAEAPAAPAALPPRTAPATAGELMGKPTVPGQPIMRGRSANVGMPRGGGGGGASPPVRQILPQMRPNMPNPDRPTNPMGLSPNSPFKYEKGGMVKKHGSSTCVHSMTKHRS